MSFENLQDQTTLESECLNGESYAQISAELLQHHVILESDLEKQNDVRILGIDDLLKDIGYSDKMVPSTDALRTGTDAATLGDFDSNFEESLKWSSISTHKQRFAAAATDALRTDANTTTEDEINFSLGDFDSNFEESLKLSSISTHKQKFVAAGLENVKIINAWSDQCQNLDDCFIIEKSAFDNSKNAVNFLERLKGTKANVSENNPISKTGMNDCISSESSNLLSFQSLDEQSQGEVISDGDHFTDIKDVGGDVAARTHNDECNLSCDTEMLFFTNSQTGKENCSTINSSAKNAEAKEIKMAEVFSDNKPFVKTRQNNIASQESKKTETPSNQMEFNDLPTEIMLNIFSYFSPKELCVMIAPVCRQWKDCAYDPILWQELVLDFNLNPFVTTSVIARAKYVRRLSLHGRQELSASDLKYIFTHHCRFMEYLDLGFCESVREPVISSIVNNCYELQTVNFEGCNNLRPSCIPLLCSLPKLNSLNLSHCMAMVEDESLVYLAEHLKEIRSLNVDGVTLITDSDVQQLLNKHKSNLHYLHLDGAELTDDAFINLPYCQKLQGFCVSFAEMVTDDMLRKIKMLPCLTKLRLKKGQDFSTLALIELFQGPNMSKLSLLDLSECQNLSDDGVIAISNCCKHLKHLSLCWCWNITDKGLEAIVNNCSKLVYLDLLGIDKIVGLSLQTIPQKLQNLVHLDLRQCNKINDDLVLNIFKYKQDLTILNYYGEEFSMTNSGGYQLDLGSNSEYSHAMTL